MFKNFVSQMKYLQEFNTPFLIQPISATDDNSSPISNNDTSNDDQSTIMKENVTDYTDKSTSTSSNDASNDIDHHLVLERAFGETLGSRADHIISRAQNIKVSIVISHCEKTISWIPSYMKDVKFEVSGIMVFSKCGNDVEGVDVLEASLGKSVIIKRLPNVGRCDHTYSNWIHENYSRVQKEVLESSEEKSSSNNDLIFFVKDHTYNKRNYRPFRVMVATALDAGFACVLVDRRKKKGPVATELHDKKTLETFVLNEYKHFDRDENSLFNSSYSNLGEWRHNIGLKFPDSEYIRVCYGGSFLTRKEGLLSQSEDAWVSLTASLSRGDNIEEGHYAERSWASIVAPPPRDLPLNVLSDKLRPFVRMRRRGLIGRMIVPKHSPLWTLQNWHLYHRNNY